MSASTRFPCGSRQESTPESTRPSETVTCFEVFLDFFLKVEVRFFVPSLSFLSLSLARTGKQTRKELLSPSAYVQRACRSPTAKGATGRRWGGGRRPRRRAARPRSLPPQKAAGKLTATETAGSSLLPRWQLHSISPRSFFRFSFREPPQHCRCVCQRVNGRDSKKKHEREEKEISGDD